jgi:hypothetical protein
MKDRSFDEVLEQMYAVQDEVHDVLGESVKNQISVEAQLDGIIRELEEFRDENPNKISSKMILDLLGKAIAALPAIAKLIENLKRGQ